MPGLSLDVFNHFQKAYAEYKHEIGKIDFTDQLESYLENGAIPDIKYVIVDECQDLSKLQWEVVHKLAAKARRLTLAGDDKQAIYTFSGADPDTLIDHEGTRVLLNTSYRLPANLLKYAETIASRISKKTPYKIKSQRAGGKVERIRSIHQLPLDKGTWFFLTRNRMLLEYFEGELIKTGHLFTCKGYEAKITSPLLKAIKDWETLMSDGYISGGAAKTLYLNYLPTGNRVKHGYKATIRILQNDDLINKQQLVEDFGLVYEGPWEYALKIPETTKNYLLKLVKEGRLEEESRIEITTIHSTKGREADNVVVLPDMVNRTANHFEKYPDDEHRVFYVGCSRARECLYLHAPITDRYYPL